MRNKLFQILLIAAILSPSVVLGQTCPHLYGQTVCSGEGMDSLKKTLGCTSNQCVTYWGVGSMEYCNLPSKDLKQHK